MTGLLDLTKKMASFSAGYKNTKKSNLDFVWKFLASKILNTNKDFQNINIYLFNFDKIFVSKEQNSAFKGEMKVRTAMN